MAEEFSIAWNDDVAAELSGAAFEGLELAAEHLLQVSTELAPLEEGDLARSGAVTADKGVGVVAVSFDRPYAVRQHEDMTLRHDAGKKAKYLEDPMHDEADIMLALIARKASGSLGG
ncbi:hypothetical protein OWR29_25560 [Actinoplanes sp. Pm04-4]|uniref:HK97 gp10 family phage protein n=1 Tax=Paractinoplanes pyxinae TaxID=2997416 RepID=A0ABT4B4I5_9ACTN|nr:hypothetical protein [Actinoplanes pyxinae]MCY1141380.1 hypothetical protein [Actinoplanes pyxinae]